MFHVVGVSAHANAPSECAFMCNMKYGYCQHTDVDMGMGMGMGMGMPIGMQARDVP